MKNLKYCLECGKPIGASRGDKKYCSNECRTAYNNERRKQTTSIGPINILTEQREYKRIYEIILNNREILFWNSQYFADEILLRDLIGKGFNLKYFISVFTNEHGFAHNCCFDHGYHLGKEEKVYIIYRPEEIR